MSEDGAPRQPQRTCVGCRLRDEQRNLRRVAIDDGRIVDATSPRLPGRGAYAHEDCMSLALQRRAFSRALRSDAPMAFEH